MQDEEFAADTLGHARAACDQHLRGAIGTDADGDSFADRPVGIDVFRVHVGGQRAVDRLGHVLQGELAECDQIAAAKEVGQRLFGAVHAVDIAAAHAGLQRLRREVGHHDLVGALHHPVRHGLADRNAGDALHGGRDALNVLHVHGGEDVDVGIEHVEHILVTLAMLAAFDVGMGEFVDQDDLRLSRENGVDVHLFEDDALVVDFLGMFLELFGKLCSAWPAMGFDHADDDVLAALVPADCFAEHVVGLAHAGRVAEKELEGAACLLRRNLFQPFFRTLCSRGRDCRECP